MLTTTEIRFSFLFTTVLILELIFGSLDSLFILHYITKPLLLLSLIGFVLKYGASSKKPLKTLLVGALSFSLIGDILLMFTDKGNFFFILGLVAFLITHILYSILFFKQRDIRNKRKKPLILAFVLILYASTITSLIFENLGNLFIPVAYYIVIISTMMLMAYTRRGNINILSYNLVFFGAVLFVVSDSILALNKFYSEIPYSHIWIILSYALAQLGITIGILKSVNH